MRKIKSIHTLLEAPRNTKTPVWRKSLFLPADQYAVVEDSYENKIRLDFSISSNMNIVFPL